MDGWMLSVNVDVMDMYVCKVRADLTGDMQRYVNG
jgi:hypothetical protein